MLISTCLLISTFWAGSEAVTGVFPANRNFSALLGGTALLQCTIQGLTQSEIGEWSFQPQVGGAITIAQLQGNQQGSVQANLLAPYNRRAQLNGTSSAGQFNLVLRNITVTDQGRYTCGVSGQQLRIQPYLIVYQPPRILTMTYDGSSSPSLTRVPVKRKVTVECMAPSVSPIPSVNWYLSSSRRFTPANMLRSGVGRPRVLPDQGRPGYFTVTSSISTEFKDGDKNKILTCSVDFRDKIATKFTQVTLGADTAIGSKLLLALLVMTGRLL